MDGWSVVVVGVGVSLAVGLAGCTPRELAWLVPRASVGVALRTHEGQVASAGFVLLTSPTERPPRPVRRRRGDARSIRLTGATPPCRVTEACRWERRARVGTVADLVEDPTLVGGGAP